MSEHWQYQLRIDVAESMPRRCAASLATPRWRR